MNSSFMPTVSIGEFNLSEIILGTDQFGTSISKQRCFELLDCYYGRGGRTIDTARAYGGRYGRIGLSEAIIGEWLRAHTIKDLLIISKGGHPPYHNSNTQRIGLKELREDIEKSCEALNLSCLPLFLLHRDNQEIEPSKIVDMMNDLVLSGAIKAYGLSNFRSRRIESVLKASDDQGCVRPLVSEIHWSIMQTTPRKMKDEGLVTMNEQELDWYRKTDFPLLAYGSQAKGFIAKTLRYGLASNSAKALERYNDNSNTAVLENIAALSDKSGLSPTQIALAYIRKGSIKTALPIVGCSTIEQLKDSLSYLDADKEILRLIDFSVPAAR